MNNNKPKENWGKPKLIVIARGDRQEWVLSACKDNGWSGFGTPAVDYANCRRHFGSLIGCPVGCNLVMNS